MSSSTINIQLNIRVSNEFELLKPNLGECWARQSTFGSTFELAMSPYFWSRILANVELDSRHSAQHSMSSSTINIQLNIRVSNAFELLKPNLGECWARQSTFGSTFELAMSPSFWSRILANVELENRHSAQHSMSSSTIDIQLSI